MNVQGLDDFQIKIENVVSDINGRSGLSEFFIGPKYKSLKALTAEMVANLARIKTLTSSTNPIKDPAVKFVLQNQINLFTEQNDKLREFVIKRESGLSLFGWLVKPFN
jgi:hypothetical protein